jgi:hypothetical protein
VSSEEQHVALPKLYGAPAYARPPRPAEEQPKPFDPDELPLEAEWTPDERELASRLVGTAYAPTVGNLPLASGHGHGQGALEGRPLRLRSLAGRILGGGR